MSPTGTDSPCSSEAAMMRMPTLPPLPTPSGQGRPRELVSGDYRVAASVDRLGLDDAPTVLAASALPCEDDAPRLRVRVAAPVRLTGLAATVDPHWDAWC